ncbi:MAG: hypothetical protein Q9221_007116 [Calogaya cf. arnoldii]
MLGIIASYAIARIRFLSLPIPQSTTIATLLLPLLTALSIRMSQTLLTPSRTIPPFKRSLPTWLTPLLFLSLTIYDTVLVFIVLLIYRGRRDPSMQHFDREYAGLIHSGEDTEDNNDGHGDSVRGRIEAPYRDNISSEINEDDAAAEDEAQGQDRRDAGPRNGGMVVQPSSMQGAGSEWRT